MSVEQRTSGVAVRAGSPAAWLVAVRPRTLLVAISPVLVGAALGWQRTGALDLGVSLVVLAAALLMQVVSNLQNDVGYTVRGGESTGTRSGHLCIGGARSGFGLFETGLGIDILVVEIADALQLGLRTAGLCLCSCNLCAKRS